MQSLSYVFKGVQCKTSCSEMLPPEKRQGLNLTGSLAYKASLAMACLLLGIGCSSAKAATITNELNKAALLGVIEAGDQAEIITNYSSLKRSPDKDFQVMAATYNHLAKRGILARRAFLMQSALSVFAKHGDKAVGTRIKLHGSIVVARVSGAGWQVHPLASAGSLNAQALTSKGAVAAGESLLKISVNGKYGRRFEYLFSWYNAPPRWISGMAQAVAASAFARLYSRTGDQRWRRAALSSLKPMLLPPLRGTTVKGLAGDNSLLYPSQPKMLVANAQLWATISAQEVAVMTGDPQARLLADRLLAQSLFELPLYASEANWTLYQIGGKPASREYHYLTVQALRRLCKTRVEFCGFADRYGGEVPLSIQSLSFAKLANSSNPRFFYL